MAVADDRPGYLTSQVLAAQSLASGSQQAGGGSAADLFAQAMADAGLDPSSL